MKKLSILRLLSISILLVGCSSQTNTIESMTEQERQELGMTIHMCLMGGGENCDAYLDTKNKEQYGPLVQEQCDMMPGMEACDVYFGQ